MPKAKKSGAGEAKESKTNTSLRLERKTLKALKVRAIEEDTSVQKIIEKLIEGYLKKAAKRES
ncbi:ribbon-helix-helix protein, CopG family [Paracoccus aestuariivivens]|uniref:Ribbon-helix-helix protein, CopG family n=1 Tax=Paracoccus aestuariivivens TaxID=1820333 RepID=A0A6L6JCG5_9RHOB|nr:ribbon-helix-helix protein, CopG family [Paracoccus aestuariivivens]MTH77874.1 ribbon-helix-helix protein, CopG family [Paracoccus aestuariivivens]